jgi:hypothetical protein
VVVHTDPKTSAKEGKNMAAEESKEKEEVMNLL